MIGVLALDTCHCPRSRRGLWEMCGAESARPAEPRPAQMSNSQTKASPAKSTDNYADTGVIDASYQMSLRLCGFYMTYHIWHASTSTFFTVPTDLCIARKSCFLAFVLYALDPSETVQVKNVGFPFFGQKSPKKGWAAILLRIHPLPHSRYHHSPYWGRSHQSPPAASAGRQGEWPIHTQGGRENC